VIGAIGLRKGERNKQPTGFSSSHAKTARTKDDDDGKEDWEITLNTYGVSTPGTIHPGDAP
jgi:hypothetical protein